MTTCDHCGIKTPNITAHYDVAHRKQEEMKLEQEEAARVAKLQQVKADKKANRSANATNNVLLFWEEIPETAKVFQLKVTDEELALLSEIHDKLFDDRADENYREIKDLLEDESVIYASGEADGVLILDLSGKTTLVCTGLTQEATYSDEEDEILGLDLEDKEEEAEEELLSVDPKAYYFQAYDEDEDGSMVTIAPKQSFDRDEVVQSEEFISDYLTLSDKFEELEPSLFVYSGTILQAFTELSGLGMTSNSGLVEKEEDSEE